MSSDGTPQIPYGSAGKSSDEGEGRLFDILAPNDFMFNVFEDAFRGDVLLDQYPAAKTNGTSAAVTFTEHNAHGFLDFITGTDNDGYAGQGIGLQYTGDRGVLMEFLFTTPSSIANYKLEVGASDADDDPGAVNSKTTPTVTATDCAVLVYDTAHSSSLDLIHVKNGGTATRITNSDFVLAVSTLYYVTLRIDGDNFKASIQGLSGTPTARFEYSNAVAAAGIEGGNKLTPWFFTQARAGSASKTAPLSKWRAIEPAY